MLVLLERRAFCCGVTTSEPARTSTLVAAASSEMELDMTAEPEAEKVAWEAGMRVRKVWEIWSREVEDMVIG